MTFREGRREPALLLLVNVLAKIIRRLYTTIARKMPVPTLWNEPMEVEFHDADGAAILLSRFNHFHDAVLTGLQCDTKCSSNGTAHKESMDRAMTLVIQLSHYNFESSRGKVAHVSLRFNEVVRLHLDWRLFADCDWGITRIGISECESPECPHTRLHAAIEWSVLRNGTWQTFKALGFQFVNAMLVSDVG